MVCGGLDTPFTWFSYCGEQRHQYMELIYRTYTNVPFSSLDGHGRDPKKHKSSLNRSYIPFRLLSSTLVWIKSPHFECTHMSIARGSAPSQELAATRALASIVENEQLSVFW